MKHHLHPLCLVVVFSVFAISGCKQSNLLHCPDLSQAKLHNSKTLSFGNRRIHHQQHNSTIANAVVVKTDSARQNKSLIAAVQVLPVSIKIPSALEKNLQDGNELNEMNKLLANYSNNKVILQQNDKGRFYLKAKSVTDIFKLSKQLNAKKFSIAKRDFGDDDSRAAHLSLVLGAVGFAFAFLPALSFAALPICIAAIVMAAKGLHSDLHRKAVTGMILGCLGFAIGVIASILYTLIAIGIAAVLSI